MAWSFAARRPADEVGQRGLLPHADVAGGHTAVRKTATDGGTRYLSLPDYSLELLAGRSLQADFAAPAPLARELTARLDRGRSIELRTRLGSQLRVAIDGRQGNCCPGLCDRDGMPGSPPDAEANIAGGRYGRRHRVG